MQIIKIIYTLIFILPAFSAENKKTPQRKYGFDLTNHKKSLSRSRSPLKKENHYLNNDSSNSDNSDNSDNKNLNKKKFGFSIKDYIEKHPSSKNNIFKTPDKTKLPKNFTDDDWSTPNKTTFVTEKKQIHSFQPRLGENNETPKK